MKTKYRVATMSALVFLLGAGAVRCTPDVGATPTGQIVGTVKLDGPAPHPRTIDMSKDPGCIQVGKGSSPAVAEGVVVGANGGLANVVLYLSQGLNGTEARSSQPVTIVQKGCRYIPHVVAVNPDQPMRIVNDDKTIHNIHPEPRKDSGNQAWNKSQMEGSPAIDFAWSNEEVAIPVKCNIHPWMRAYIVVVKGPSSVSSEAGAFKLEGVAPGSYTLAAWHETYGTQTQNVVVAAGKTATVDLTFRAK
jgi:plastocyanin